MPAPAGAGWGGARREQEARSSPRAPAAGSGGTPAGSVSGGRGPGTQVSEPLGVGGRPRAPPHDYRPHELPELRRDPGVRAPPTPKGEVRGSTASGMWQLPVPPLPTCSSPPGPPARSLADAPRSRTRWDTAPPRAGRWWQDTWVLAAPTRDFPPQFPLCGGSGEDYSPDPARGGGSGARDQGVRG